MSRQWFWCASFSPVSSWIRKEIGFAFCIPHVTSAQWNIGTERYVEKVLTLTPIRIYFLKLVKRLNHLSNTYQKINSFNLLLVKSQKGFRRYEQLELYAFHLRCQRNLPVLNILKEDFSFSILLVNEIKAGTVDYALILRDEILSVSSDKQKHFELLQFISIKI